MEFATLNNGVQVPLLGYGVYQIGPDEVERCVSDALEVGYRLIDTAQAYGNEEGVGAAIATSGIAREDVFVQSKVWVANASYERAKASIDESIEKIGGGYIDLMLLHQAYGDYHGAYRAMEEAYDEGRLRAIGVSNFYSNRLIDLCAFARVVPAINQVETHVFAQRAEDARVMSSLGVLHQAWAPLAEGVRGVFENPVLVGIAEAHGKSSAQVMLRWLLQRGVSVIPKSSHKERMAENFDVFDFELTADEMTAIVMLDEGAPFIWKHHDPEITRMLCFDIVKEAQLGGGTLY